MTKELQKRLITSIGLLVLVFFCIFSDLIITILALVIISALSWLEFTKLIKKIYYKKRKNLKFNFILFSGAIYFIIFGLISFYLIDYDKFYFIYILSVCAFSDIGGYLFGKYFKGRKLTKISPNKTISGSIGSFIFSLVPYILLSTIYNLGSEIFINIFICLYLSLACQAGDLFISYFKRKAKVKDTGNILPGHGGLLDRIDGIVFAIPSLTILIFLLNI